MTKPKTDKPKRQVKAWAVFGCGNAIYVETISRTRFNSKLKIEESLNEDWFKLQKIYGYQVKKVLVTEL